MSPARAVRVVRRSLRGALCSVALVAVAADAAAQRGVVKGVVKDDLGKPIESVEVSVPTASVSVRTDSAGQFTLSSLGSGSTDFSFRRLSYAPVVLTVIVPRDDTTEVDITLTVVAQRLKGMIVQEDADHLRQLDGFETRRKQGYGHFITRSQIEQRSPGLLSDMVRMVPGAMLVPSEHGRVVLRFARNGRTGCPPQFFIDGVQAAGFNIDDMPVSDVEGVELYSGSATLPPEFNKVTSTVICGAVLIWTRIPGS